MRYETAALKLALDALENTASRRASEQFVIEQHAIAFIKKALDRLDPAPVAKNEEGRITWLIDDWPQNCLLYAEPPSWTPVEIGVDVTNEGAHVVGMYVLMPDVVRHVFYSQFHPAPQRTWVNATTWRGLTDEEIEARAANFYNPEMYKRAVLWAQEKLKERNQ